MATKEEKMFKFLAGKQRNTEEKEGLIDKLKMTWYFNTTFSKFWYIASSLALIFLILRLIAGKGLW